MLMIRLLAVDMDGTCLNRKNQISEQNMAALRRLAQSGIQIVPASGRASTCLPHQLRAAPLLFRYAITSNGARVDDVRGHCLFCQEIYPDTALSLLSDCQTLRIGISAHIRREYLLQGRLLQMMGKAVYGKDADQARCVPDLRPLIKQSRGAEELQFYFFSRTAREALRQILSYYPTLNAVYSSSYVEIFSAEASKGKALSALAQHLHLDRSQIACIGDSENDLSMFEAVGTRFAVGNAIDALKRQADHVLPDRDHDPITAAAAILGI